MARESSPYLDMWKDWEPAVRVRNAKGALVSGLTGLTFRVSLTEQGAAIGTLTGIAATEDGTTAEYVGAVDLATLTSELPSNTYPHDTIIYLQLHKAGDIVVEPIKKRIRRLVYG
jgi:hypothetical protein